MLESASDQIRKCPEQAEVYARKAETARDELRSDYLAAPKELAGARS
jgi:hypothetical protein